MIKYVLIFVLVSMAFLAMSWRSNPIGTTTLKSIKDTAKTASNYRNFCGGCHGEKMDAFVDRDWKHGNNRKDLYRGIKNGYYDEGMPGFDSAFSNQEMYDLADYILEGIERLKKYKVKNISVKENRFVSEGITVHLDTVVSGLRSIWGMAFLPDGRILLTEKFGKVYIAGARGQLQEIEGAPEVSSDNQGGLMDVVLHPDFKTNHLVYLSYSRKENTGNGTTTAILRSRLDGNRLVDQLIIFEANPYSRTRHHYGSRMVFGRDGYLYFSVGERGNERENPQSLANDLGKIHRIKDDGSIPADNPFVNTAGARPSIYSYGHRNPQGLTVNPFTGEIWSHEHGPRGGDEINIIRKGANYGWPVITYGINYNGRIISKETAREGMEQPVKYWIPSIAPSGMAFVEGDRYKPWKGQLLSGSLRFNYLNLSRLDGNKVTSEELLLKNAGRFRDVRMGPDGYIYVAVENPGFVFRLIPE